MKGRKQKMEEYIQKYNKWLADPVIDEKSKKELKAIEGNEEEMLFDYGFVCLGMRANTPVLSEIEEAFSDTNVEIVNIGDSKRARRIIEGTEEGRNILNVLARHDYL